MTTTALNRMRQNFIFYKWRGATVRVCPEAMSEDEDSFFSAALEKAMKKGAESAFFIILPVLSGLVSFGPGYCTRRSMVMRSTSTRRLGSRHLISAGSCLSVQATTGSASPFPCAFSRAASTPLLAR